MVTAANPVAATKAALALESIRSVLRGSEVIAYFKILSVSDN